MSFFLWWHTLGHCSHHPHKADGSSINLLLMAPIDLMLNHQPPSNDYQTCIDSRSCIGMGCRASSSDNEVVEKYGLTKSIKINVKPYQIVWTCSCGAYNMERAGNRAMAKFWGENELIFFRIGRKKVFFNPQICVWGVKKSSQFFGRIGHFWAHIRVLFSDWLLNITQQPQLGRFRFYFSMSKFFSTIFLFLFLGKVCRKSFPGGFGNSSNPCAPPAFLTLMRLNSLSIYPVSSPVCLHSTSSCCSHLLLFVLWFIQTSYSCTELCQLYRINSFCDMWGWCWLICTICVALPYWQLRGWKIKDMMVDTGKSVRSTSRKDPHATWLAC